MKLNEVKQKNEKVLSKAQKIQEFLINNPQEMEKEIYEVRDAFFFYTAISSQNVQSKAPLSEKFIANKMDWKRVKASEGRGDFLDSSENGYGYIELKNSFTNKEEKLNLRQIRLWQDVDYYLCIYIDEENLENSSVFLLTKEQMTKEVENMGGYTHGTVEANKDNKNKEYSITLPVKKEKNEHTVRWNNEYSSEELKLKIISSGD